jgi:multisubunit Na+/H+ antiporter MnhE subunit
MLLGVTPGTYVTDVDQNTGTLTIHALVPPSGVERALARPTQGGPGDGPTEDERRESR